MPLDPLAIPLLKIERANKHIRDADKAIKRFRRDKPDSLFVDFDAQSGNELVKLHLKPIPDDIGDSASCAIHNIRSALDALAWAAAHRNGPPANPRSVDFTIVGGAEDLKSARIRRKIEAIGADWAGFIEGVKPYPGGDDLLCALNAADIEDKHRSIIEVVG